MIIEMLGNYFAVFFIEILANYELVVSERVWKNVFMEVYFAESQFKQKYELSGFVGECAPYFENRMLALA